MSLGAVSTVIVVTFSAVLIASLKKQTIAFKIFTHPKIVYIGLISYSLYLWHWGVLSISRWTIGIYWWSIPFQVALMLSLAIASYQYIETPLRKGNWFGKRWKTLIVSGSILVALSGGLIALGRPLKGQLYAGKRWKIVFLETWWKDKDGNYIEKCHVKKSFTTELMKECLGSTTRKNSPIGYLIGDSHARNYLIAARKALTSFDIKYMTMGSGCAFFPSEMISDKLDKDVSCNQYVKSVTSLILKESRRGDIVFIGQALYDRHHDKNATQIYFDHIKVLAEELREKKIPVVIFDGTFPPMQKKDMMLCMKQFIPFPDKIYCEKNINKARSSYNRFDKLAVSLSNSSENIYYAPLRLGLCVNETCGQLTKKGTPIWHDRGHISEKSSGELADMLRQYLIKTNIKIPNKK